MSLATAPFFFDIDTNSPWFRSAMDKASKILVNENVYSRHRHPEVDLQPGEVISEQRVSADELLLKPIAKEEAAMRGKPSCWGFARDENGTVDIVPLRYADNILHEQSSIDVTSNEFAARLNEIAKAFVAAEIDSIFELNIMSSLFPPPEGHVTIEHTFRNRCQSLTFTPTPTALLNGDWRGGAAACWHFVDGKPQVTGMCTILEHEHK